MNRTRLRSLIFMALCCDLGIFAKKLIVPAANILTDSLHIPGGIGTSFSIMFLVIAAAFIPRFGAGTLMGAVQSGIALSMGTVGSMGALAPIGYILPGLAIDCVMYLARCFKVGRGESMVLANAAASVMACLTANLIVFRLQGVVLCLYICVSILSGTVCGTVAAAAAKKLEPVFGKDVRNEKENSNRNSNTCNTDGNICDSSPDNSHA